MTDAAEGAPPPAPLAMPARPEGVQTPVEAWLLSPEEPTPLAPLPAASEPPRPAGAAATPRSTKRAAAAAKPSLGSYILSQLSEPSEAGPDAAALALAHMRWDRVWQWLSVPPELEVFLWFGYVVCLDTFLALFTFLPLRVLAGLWWSLAPRLRASRGPPMSAAKRAALLHDVLRLATLAAVCVVLQLVDGSWLYHTIRGQTTLKLYVIFNALEITDRLCSSFGQDLLGSLALHTRLSGAAVRHLAMSIIYVAVHAVVHLLQVITLNVAINSHSPALLPLLLSNQFVEIKGSVFKRYTVEGLFQLSCGDVVERFQLVTFLCLIGLRNWAELGNAVTTHAYLFGTLLPQMTVFAVSEVSIDWLKHAFITKFNRISPTVYRSFVSESCRDLVDAPGRPPRSTLLLSQRIGFTALPLACVLLRVVYRSLTAVADASGVPLWAVLLVAYAGCWAAKLAVGLSLAQRAAAARGAECREGKAAAAPDANGTATEWTVHVIDRFTLPMPRRQTAPQ